MSWPLFRLFGRTAPHCTSLHCCTPPHCIAPHPNPPHSTALHCTGLHCTTTPKPGGSAWMRLCHAAPSGSVLAENTASSVRKVCFSHQPQVLSSHQQEGIELTAVLRTQCKHLTAEPVSPNTTSDAGERRRSRRLIGAWVSPAHGYNEGVLVPLVSADSGPTAPGCLAGAHAASHCSGQTPGCEGVCMSRTRGGAQRDAGASPLCKGSQKQQFCLISLNNHKLAFNVCLATLTNNGVVIKDVLQGNWDGSGSSVKP